MKNILGTQIIKVPKDVTIDVKNRVVTVKGPRGTLVKAFKHVDLEFIRLGKRRVKVNMWFATRKNMACLQTVCSHIKNLFKGVQYGFRLKMRAVYAHFPINITSTQDNTVVDIRNFLGEKFTRTVNLKPGVTCTPTGNKDEIQVEGNDIEMVTLSAALIHQAVLVKEKDIRKFLDGIYVSEEGTIVQKK